MNIYEHSGDHHSTICSNIHSSGNRFKTINHRADELFDNKLPSRKPTHQMASNRGASLFVKQRKPLLGQNSTLSDMLDGVSISPNHPSHRIIFKKPPRATDIKTAKSTDTYTHARGHGTVLPHIMMTESIESMLNLIETDYAPMIQPLFISDHSAHNI